MKKILGFMFLIVICSLNLSADLNDGLVAHYPFNGNANDESGNGNDGTVNGATLTTDRFDVSESAYNFDGLDNMLSAINTGSLAICTISVWLYNLGGDGSAYQMDTIFGLSRSGQTSDIMVGIANDNKIGLYLSEVGGTDFYTENSYLNIWTNIVFVYNNSDWVDLYINGDFIVRKSISSQWYSSNLPFGDALYNYDEGFLGKLDDIRIYNRSLTTQEIQEIYSNLHTDFNVLPISFIGEPIQFTDTSLGSPITWEWDFENDGIYDSFIQNPTNIYNSEGIYSVKLKISNGTLVDSLIKENLIAVSYCPPDTVQNVQIVIDYPNANISWDTVTTNENGAIIEVDGYIVLFSENDEDYFYLYSTTETNYSHIRVVEHRTQMFYNVVAFKNYNREQIEYLERLNNSREKLKWSEVKQKLEEKRGINFEN